MEVLILAAGRGERMRPLTDHAPKPLLEIGGESLIERHVNRLVAAGHRDLVVNHAHLGGRITDRLGNGSCYGARITYSPEPAGALETGGGIVQALQYMQGECFAVVNGDIWTDFPFSRLPRAPEGDAWLLLVDNPDHHPEGDFALRDGHVREKEAGSTHSLTFAGIAVYRRTLFEDLQPDRYPLLPILLPAVRSDTVGGEHYHGEWHDIGTPERLEALRARAAAAEQS